MHITTRDRIVYSLNRDRPPVQAVDIICGLIEINF